MLMLKLEGIQQQRRDSIFKYLNNWSFPPQILTLTKKINEETENNTYLKKNTIEQRITIEALKGVLQGHKGYLDSLADIFENYEKILEETGLEINKDYIDKINENRRLDPQGKV